MLVEHGTKWSSRPKRGQKVISFLLLEFMIWPFFSLFQFKCVYFVAKFYTRTSLQTLDYHTHTYTDDILLAFAWAITVMLRPNYSLLVMCMYLYCELLCLSLFKSGLRSSHSLLISAVNHVLCSNCSKHVHDTCTCISKK